MCESNKKWITSCVALGKTGSISSDWVKNNSAQKWLFRRNEAARWENFRKCSLAVKTHSLKIEEYKIDQVKSYALSRSRLY